MLSLSSRSSRSSSPKTHKKKRTYNSAAINPHYDHDYEKRHVVRPEIPGGSLKASDYTWQSQPWWGTGGEYTGSYERLPRSKPMKAGLSFSGFATPPGSSVAVHDTGW